MTYNNFDVERTSGQGTIHLFYACVLLLTGLGLAVLYSSSYAFAARFFKNGNYFFVRQAVFAGIGIVFFFVFSHLNLEKLRKYIILLLLAAAVLCVLTLVPGIGVERLGASRWIEIGSQTYQPSEMVKFVLLLYLAHIFDKKADNLDSFGSGVLPPVLITGIFFGLVYVQNNFSTAVFIVCNALVVFFLAGIRYRYFFSAIAIMIPVSALLVFTAEHRVRRLVSFIMPEWDPLGAGYQVRASRLTIISGGLLGKGVGQGVRK
ncbi:MAG: FtsW/RodA/SpoVE family cell cycle protein, partial [Treponema sp.]|nr:FtsW/RodA/SpoVE family cell cycle protein [Treponema sp.]